MLSRRVLLVNSQPIFRAGIRTTIEAAGGFRVVGEASSGYQAMQVCERARPDLLLVDVDLAGMSGYAIVSALAQAVPGRAALLLAEAIDHEIYDRARASGAAGALSNRAGSKQLVRTLRQIARDQPILWEPEHRPITQPMSSSTRLVPAALTMREIEVLDCLAQGFSNRTIAEVLFVNEQTVKNHLTSIFRKLGVDDRMQALTLLVRRGWADFSA